MRASNYSPNPLNTPPKPKWTRRILSTFIVLLIFAGFVVALDMIPKTPPPIFEMQPSSQVGDLLYRQSVTPRPSNNVRVTATPTIIPITVTLNLTLTLNPLQQTIVACQTWITYSNDEGAGTQLLQESFDSVGLTNVRVNIQIYGHCDPNKDYGQERYSVIGIGLAEVNIIHSSWELKDRVEAIVAVLRDQDEGLFIQPASVTINFVDGNQSVLWTAPLETALDRRLEGFALLNQGLHPIVPT